MAIEIERKFLLKDDGWRSSVQRSEQLCQGYLDPMQASVRVRIGGERAWLNIKSRVKGASRLEFEYEIPRGDAEQLLQAMALPGQIRKVRHEFEVGGMLWEIDEFAGDNEGLVVAEIELPSLDAAFERPSWVGREVTDELRYYNSALAERPWSRWSKEEKMFYEGEKKLC